MKRFTLIFFLILLQSNDAQNCECNNLENPTVGVSNGMGRLTTLSSDNQNFNFYHPRWRGGWLWSSNSSKGDKAIMELKNINDRGTDVNLIIGNGQGSVKLTSFIPDNKHFDFFIPRWRAGWRWTSSSSEGVKSIMELKNSLDKAADVNLTLV